MIVGAGFKPARNNNDQTENSVRIIADTRKNHKQVCGEKLPNGENRNMGKQIEFIKLTLILNLLSFQVGFIFRKSSCKNLSKCSSTARTTDGKWSSALYNPHLIAL